MKMMMLIMKMPSEVLLFAALFGRRVRCICSEKQSCIILSSHNLLHLSTKNSSFQFKFICIALFNNKRHF